MKSENKNSLEHIAIIMDGNRRWAKSRGLPRMVGHKKGSENVKKVIQAASEFGVKYVTLYAFSTENWQRSPEEVKSLMDLLREYMNSDIKELQKDNVRIVFIGERNMLDRDIIDRIALIEKDTQNNDKITVCIALSYGSRQEIVQAAKKIANLAKKGDISPDDVDIKMFSDMLYTRDIPDPDLVIRTGGEQRLSNYLLWQVAYSELYFSSVLWPDFDKDTLATIIEDYNHRERRYGKI